MGVTQEWSVHFDKIRSALNHTANIKEYTIRTHDYLSQRSHLYTSKTKFNSHTQLVYRQNRQKKYIHSHTHTIIDDVYILHTHIANDLQDTHQT